MARAPFQPPSGLVPFAGGKDPEEGSLTGQAGPNGQDEHDGEVIVQTGKPRLKEPPRFAVVLHNDDYTTMEFVVEILEKYFHKTADEAAQIMLRVHHEGKGVAGLYSHQIAETKAAQVIEYAKSRGYPLMCTVEPG